MLLNEILGLFMIYFDIYSLKVDCDMILHVFAIMADLMGMRGLLCLKDYELDFDLCLLNCKLPNLLLFLEWMGWLSVLLHSSIVFNLVE